MKKGLKSAIWRYYAYSFFANLWFFILNVPTGIIADKIGRKYALVAGTIIAGLIATHSLHGATVILGILSLLLFFFSPAKQYMFDSEGTKAETVKVS